ncbi:MAG: tetratricopeptide repeat protein [Thermoanaerobaculales bacterium]|jgi:tetratricopeptide (TPR) repeat protein|nr:tetratricopeptide repeat protein [Thermoanaerobaculales bacterium]
MTAAPGGAGDLLRPWKLLGAVSTAVIVVAVPLSLVIEPVGRGAAGPVAPPVFVGRERCAGCHAAAAEAWAGSDHDLAMAEATEETVLGDFADATFVHRGITSLFFRRDGGFFVRTEGPDGEMGDFEIAYTFGHDPLQQYLVPFPGGRLQALSIAWDSVRGEWFHLYPDRDIPPDDWLHWTRNAQNWNGMCAECHSTNLVKGYDFASRSFSTTWSEIDVSCEACHGPGSAHVAWAELPPMARPVGDGDGLVVQTSGITSREQVELCAPCHSRRSELGDFSHSSHELLDRLVPALLDEGLYHPDGQILDEVYVYGSFLQSKMYANDVRCSDCHDVHSLELRAEGNELCGQCHRLDTYDSPDHHFHKKVVDGKPSAGARCVSCHMPERPFMVVDWRADHSFRVPRPDLTRSIGVPNACGQTGCHADKSLDWQIAEHEAWYGRARKPHYGTVIAGGRAGSPEAREPLIRLAGDPLYPAIVRATAISLLGGYDPDAEVGALFDLALADPEPIIRRAAVEGLPGMTAEQLVEKLAPLLFDPVRGVRTLAASRLAGAPDGLLRPYQRDRLAEVVAEHEADMLASMDFAFAGHNLGNLAARLGDSERAVEMYRAALEVDGLFIPAKMNLAVLLSSLGRNDEAEVLLREVLDAQPEDGQATYSLGLLLAEMGRVDEAVALLERTVELEPDWVRAHYNLGLALQAVGRIEDAGTALRRAVELDPTSLDALLALADHYARTGDLQAALVVARRMTAAHPDNPLGRDLTAELERALGGPS